MDKIASLRAFTKVVDLGSFSEAAREMRLSRSAISKQIMDLERELGVQLLNRTTRSTSPTENGQAYYQRCVVVLAELDEADQSVTRLHAEPRGVLHVNAPMSFGTLHLGNAIADFMEKYPDLRVLLTLSDQLLDPVQEGFDVTLRIADLPSSSLIARKIVAADRRLCAAPAYLKQHGTPERPDDLRKHACLSYGHLATGNQWKLTGPDGDHWIAVSWALCADNAEILRDAAIKGRGIALLPTFIAGPDIKAGRLTTVLRDYHAPALSVYAVYVPTRHLPAKVRVFIDFLVKRFAGAAPWDQGLT